MNKKIKIVLILSATFIIFFCTYFLLNNNDENIKEKNSKPDIKEEKIEKNNFVSYNGYLSIKDNTLVNQYNEKIQLKGMSSHGMQWYSRFTNEEMISKLKNEWNTNLFRIAMYTKEGGYLDDKSIKNKVYDVINLAIKYDMYVIVDWHILSDYDPLMYKEDAKEFFMEVSKKYKDYPNVIYEVCNEPNGNVTWEDNIKPYATEVINVIRENNKKSIIIVGTPTWSQDVDKVINNQIDDKNTMYALHFYAGTHTSWLRDRVKNVINEVPIFVSEWGTSDASGNNGVYLDESRKWIDFMNEYNISWANWSLSDKNESSALLIEGSPVNSLDDEYLSESGKFIKEVVK